jgi:signal transduction histidine kinase
VPARTRLNTEALTEALLNLLDNAMKFSAEHRTLKVRTGSQPGEVYVEVEDSGIGIPRELQSKIFERFYRVTASAENQKRGSGLGLALVKQIMDTHSGRVDLWSRPGQGSTFRLTFSSTAESDSSP